MSQGEARICVSLPLNSIGCRVVINTRGGQGRGLARRPAARAHYHGVYSLRDARRAVTSHARAARSARGPVVRRRTA
ncbi:hypothetical protein EVAR_85104_1 [Eumeta japonica]|uniref:Uncharacterized protein n=1 Tax=Eumeta variegata TaxID=151549 RepID=A0A4C1XPJ0_EUMVA|nr:hypothetical protein EVAR_85104_1 [Eumeta japonica]